MKKNIIKKLFAIFLIINTSLFIVSLVISFALVFKPFYYYHINSLNITNQSGYTELEIKEAYDDVIDYLVLDKPFKTGKLKYSDVGYDHFKDCKLLFNLNFFILGFSSVIIILKKIYFNNIKVFKHNISFLSSILNIFVFILIFVSSIIVGFSETFEIFHRIFFLGKDNWLLDRNTDEIIKILPQDFFMNLAILVVSLIIVISILIVIREIIIGKKKK